MMCLVERESQIAQLNRLLSACRQGQGAVAVIAGPVASGKSHLLYAFAGEAMKAGTVVLAASGAATESSLPLGTLGQLLHNAPSISNGGGPKMGMPETTLTAMLPDIKAGGPSGARAMERIRGTLLAKARGLPLLIGVDDANEADPLSLQCLVYCARRIRSAPVLVVLTAMESPQLGRPAPFVDFLRLPHCHQIQLTPLSKGGVAEVVAEKLDGSTDPGVPAWHSVSGGNPLLLAALLEDQQSPEPDAPQRPTSPFVGPAFGRAVLNCLQRGGPGLLETAHGLAILGDRASPKLIGSLIGTDPISARTYLRALDAAGLAATGRFRHSRARIAVLESLAPEERACLHLRAARLLYDAGAPAEGVADHLIAADQASDPWALPLLRQTAGQALTDNRVERAVECLKLADQVSAEPAQRATVKAQLAGAEWRLDPARTIRHLPALAAGIREGLVEDRHIPSTIRLLLWHGRMADVAAVLERRPESGLMRGTENLLPAVRQWMAVWCPPLLPAERARPAQPTHPPDESRSLMERPELAAATVLGSVLRRGASEAAAAEAERILESLRLDDETLEPLVSALLTLVYCDHLDRATRWCDDLIVKAMTRHAPIWQAHLAAVRAEIALRLGDLADACEHARSALRLAPPSAWGAAIGLPLAGLIQASSAMGSFEEAEAALGIAIPEGTLKIRYGLNYLCARGQHHLAMKRFRAAINDFLVCGELMAAWKMDTPGFLPWRAGAAEAYLRLGDRGRARRLILAQLERPGADRGRVRGSGLRLTAATSELKDRPILLRDSVDTLEGCGDRLELARSLADLGRAEQALGQSSRSRAILRLATQLARECKAQPLLRALADKADLSPSQAQHPPLEVEEAGSLSEAERRVATLAARGDTNREIAKRLYVTVSTVEQHLTRVYRKLEVTGRDGLPEKLSQITLAHSA